MEKREPVLLDNVQADERTGIKREYPNSTDSWRRYGKRFPDTSGGEPGVGKINTGPSTRAWIETDKNIIRFRRRK